MDTDTKLLSKMARITRDVDHRLQGLLEGQEPPNLIQPMRYALRMRGKRLRPILVILSCEAVGGRISQCIHAALAIEILHTFTLVHDDIMDRDDIRRGQPTIHKTWDENIAILAGDGLNALAYSLLLKHDSPHIRYVTQILSEGILTICSGQSLDKDFESIASISTDAYFDMIGKKTAKLMSISAQIGAILGNAEPKQYNAVKRYGHWLGLAFQIQDDLLDYTANEQEFGKHVGSDFALGKKTYPLMLLQESVLGEDKKFLNTFLKQPNDGKAALKNIQKMIHTYRIEEQTRRTISDLIQKAVKCIRSKQLNLNQNYLTALASYIEQRTY